MALSTLAFGCSKALTFLSILVLTRLLAPSQFGVAAAVSLFLGLIELTADLGMKATVIYEQEHGHGDRIQTAFTLNMLVAITLTVVGLLAAPLVADFFHAPGHVGLFRLAALDVFLTALGSIHDALLLRDMRFGTRIVTEVISAVFRAATGVVLALLGFGAASLVWGTLAGTAAWTITQWSLTGFRPRLGFDRGIAASMVHYGIGASLLTVLAQLYAQIDPVVVGRVLGQRALGLYTVAFKAPTLVLENIANQVSLVAFPALARKRVSDAAGVGASTHRLIRYQSLYSLPVAAGMAVLARPLVEVVFSSKWRDASGVLAAVSVLSGVSAATFALGDGFKALGRQRVMVLLSLIELPLILGTIILAAPYGITAVAWARAACGAVWAAMMVITAAQVLGVSISGTLSALWPGSVAAAGVAVGAGPVRLWSGLPAFPELVVASAAGAVGGGLALALLSPGTFRKLRRAAGGLRSRRRADTPPHDSRERSPSRVGAN